jgi:hypothetical protein
MVFILPTALITSLLHDGLKRGKMNDALLIAK